MSGALSPAPLRERGAALQTGLFIAMEAAWIGALALFADAALAGGGGSPAVLLVCALYPLGLAADYMIARASTVRWTALALHAAGFAAAMTVVALSALPAGGRLWGSGEPPLVWLAGDSGAHRLIALVCLGLFCWIRGMVFSGRAVTAHAVALGFQIGLIVLLAVLAASSGFGIVWPGGTGLSLVFVLSGLLTLWHVRASAGARRGGAIRRDPSAALVGLALVLGTGLAIAAGFDRSILDLLLALLQRLGDAVGAAIMYLLALLPDPDRAPMDLPERAALPPRAPQPEPEPLFTPAEWMRRIYMVFFFGLVAIATAAILFTNFQALIDWLRRHRDRTPGLDHDRSPQGFADTLRHLWRALREALGALVWRLRGSLTPRRREAPPEEPVRRAYIGMARRLGDRGWPRAPSETPFGYARRIGPEWPGAGKDLDTLTRAYVNARYGRPRRVPAGRLRRFMKKIRRSLNKVRHRELHADNAGRHTDGH